MIATTMPNSSQTFYSLLTPITPAWTKPTEIKSIHSIMSTPRDDLNYPNLIMHHSFISTKIKMMHSERSRWLHSEGLNFFSATHSHQITNYREINLWVTETIGT
jgi:hypothetical protein